MELAKNAQAAIAIAAVLLSIAGLALTAGGYIAAYLAIQNFDKAVSPQIDAAAAAVGDTASSLSSAQQAASEAGSGLAAVSVSLSSYSASTKALSDSLSGVAAVPPFSLDSRLSTAAGELGEASASFANASSSINQSASTASNATASLGKIADDLDQAKDSLEAAKGSFKAALGMLNIASLVGALALAALFSSVLLLAVSNLIGNMPKISWKDEGEGGSQQEG